MIDGSSDEPESSSPESRTRSRRPPLRLLLRVVVYLAVVVVLWTTREEFREALPFGQPKTPDRLVISGLDVAAPLTADLVAWFERTYPEVETVRRGGGSLSALEDLLHGRCDVAFSARPPTPVEAALFRTHTGDSTLCHPVATGALVLWAGEDYASTFVSRGDLEIFLATGEAPSFRRMYVPDPNLAWWDVLLERLELSPDVRERAAERVVFLAHETAVREAVRDDPEAIGVTSDWEPSSTDGVRRLALGEAWPDHDTVAKGHYPLYHHLYVCCSESNRRQASVFVTLAVGGPGQRHIERAGFVPARWTAREVILSREGGAR